MIISTRKIPSKSLNFSVRYFGELNEILTNLVPEKLLIYYTILAQSLAYTRLYIGVYIRLTQIKAQV